MYLGVRSTGSIYGYRSERKAYSQQVRTRQAKLFIEEGILEYQENFSPFVAKRGKKHRPGRVAVHSPPFNCICPRCVEDKEYFEAHKKFFLLPNHKEEEAKLLKSPNSRGH